MELKTKLLQLNKEQIKKFVLLDHVSKNALSEGVDRIAQVENYLTQSDQYISPPLFPFLERIEPGSFYQVLSDYVNELNSNIELSYRMKEAVISSSILSFNSVYNRMNEYLTALFKMDNMKSYIRNSYRSFGSSTEVIRTRFWNKGEDSLTLSRDKCNISLNNIVTLPIDSYRVFNIKDSKITYINEEINSFNVGPILFRTRENPSREDLSFEYTLESESIINHILIPMCLPLPEYIECVYLYDSSKRLTREFKGETLELFNNCSIGSLELFFPPTPVKKIQIKFKDQLSLFNMGVEEEINLNKVEKEIVPKFVKSIELINEVYNSFEELHLGEIIDIKNIEKHSNDTKCYFSTIGAIVIPRLVKYKRTGEFNTCIYYGKNVLSSWVKSLEKNMNYESYISTGDIPYTFVDLNLVRSSYDSNENLISRVVVPHLSSRPFSSTAYELLNINSEEDSDNLVDFGNQEFILRFYNDIHSSINLYTPILDEPYLSGGTFENDDYNLMTRVKLNNLSNNDVIACYPIKIYSSPSSSLFSESRPYFYNYNGSVSYKNRSDFNKLHLSINLHRIKHSNTITPLLFRVTTGINKGE